MAATLIGSEVLKIAGEVSTLLAQGKKIANFTVGDFDPKYFPIPGELRRLISSAVDAGQTNYPPSSGLMALRESVAAFYSRDLGLPTKSSEVLIAGGARPLIYTTFLALVNPGEKVVYPVPSWNNNHYVHLSQAVGVKVEAQAGNNFMPTAEELAPHLAEARLLCLNSPLNPTGTLFDKNELLKICEEVVAVNAARRAKGARELYLMYDQIYWKILHGDSAHFNPVTLCPAVKPYTIFIDGMSKYFCGTGIRVGWAVVPEDIMPQFSAFLGHVGAWAPKPEQVACAEFLRNTTAITSFMDELHARLDARLGPLYRGILALKKAGLPVDAVRPQGGIYLSLRVQPGRGLRTNEEIRRALLEEAALAVVPFQAFGLAEDSGWFRMSVGAVDVSDIPYALEKLQTFLTRK